MPQKNYLEEGGNCPPSRELKRRKPHRERDMLMVVGYARRVSNEKQTPNKVQTDNPTIVICFGGEGLFIGGSCSWRHFLCGAAAALTVGGQKFWMLKIGYLSRSCELVI